MLAHNTTAPRPYYAACELRMWSADKKMDRKARGSHATGVERGDRKLTKPLPPTSRGVGVVEPRSTARGEARPAFAHDTSTPSPHCVARVLCGRLVLAPRRESAWAARHGIQTQCRQHKKSLEGQDDW